MTTIKNKISADIDAAQDLIAVLKPELEKFGVFDFNIITKGKENPVVMLEISYSRKTTNVLSKSILNAINLNTSNDYFVGFKHVNFEFLQTINILI